MAHQNIFQNGHAGEEADVLEGAGYAAVDDFMRFLAHHGFAIEAHVPFGHLVYAGDQVEDGGLAGAVRSDDAEDFPFVYVEGHIGNSGEATELFHYVFHFQKH